MSSQRAKELRALALSLSLVNDDLKMKRYLRKSEFYKESDRYKREREARKLAALNLAKELASKTPTISAALINAVHNAVPEIVGHGGDEEIKEGDIRTSLTPEELPKLTGATIGEKLKKEQIREQAKSLTQKNIEEAIKNLLKTPEEKVEAKQDKGLSDALFSELIDRKIDGVYNNFNNAVDLSQELLQKASKNQLIRLKNRYGEIDGDDYPTSADAANIINQHLDIIEDRLEKMEKQEQAEAELISRARKPTKPTLTRKPTPPAGPPPPSIVAKRGRGRPPSKELAERKKMKMEDINVLDPKPKRGRGRPKKTKEPILSQSETDKKLEEMLRKRQKSTLTKEQAEEMMKPPPKATRIIESGAEAGAPVIEGQGLKDYMDYMKGKRPTKDMNKLILLIGSQRAGNNSYKLKVEIDKLINKIKTDLEEKIRKNKSKSAKQQVKAIELEKRKLLIRKEAKRRLMEEAQFKTKN